MPTNEQQLKRKITHLKDDLIKNANEEIAKKDQQEQLFRKNIRLQRREMAEMRQDAKEAEAYEKLSKLQLDTKGYDNFISSYLSMVEVVKLVGETNPISALKTILGGALGAINFLKFRTPGEWLDDKINPPRITPPTTRAPDLFHYVEFNSSDELDVETSINNMCRTDGGKFSEDSVDEFGNNKSGEKSQIKQILKDGITLWLAQVDGDGYEPKKDNDKQFVKKGTNVGLTKKDFDALRDSEDPSKNFSVFLQGLVEAHELKIEQAAGPKMR
jgi:hypothetical protein